MEASLEKTWLIIFYSRSCWCLGGWTLGEGCDTPPSASHPQGGGRREGGQSRAKSPGVNESRPRLCGRYPGVTKQTAALQITDRHAQCQPLSGPGALKGGLGRAGEPARLVLKDYFHVMSFRTRPRRGPSPGFSPPGSADALSRYLASARSFGHATRWIGNELDPYKLGSPAGASPMVPPFSFCVWPRGGQSY